jgi:hypothetical protein
MAARAIKAMPENAQIQNNGESTMPSPGSDGERRRSWIVS